MPWYALKTSARILRWLKTVSSTNISMGYCDHYLSLNATIMVSKHCPIIGELSTLSQIVSTLNHC